MTNLPDIKVTGELQPDPNVCKFMVNRPVLDESTLLFKSPDQSEDSPLIDHLFAISGITKIRVSGSSITLSKNVQTPWPELARFILPAIKESLLDATRPPISPEAIESAQLEPQGDITETVTALLEQQINPALAMHGGFVKLVKVENNDVHIEMGGGCQGCAASQATMKYGVETAIREACPDVREVVDVTDHTAGANPYYR